MTDDEDSDDFWGDRDDAIVGTIEVRIFMETSNTGPEDKVLDNYDTYRRAKDVFYGVQDIKPTHSIEGGTAIEITQRKKSTIRFSYRSRNSLQLAGVISASPTPKTHASIESSGDEQSQTAGEELTTGKDGDTTSLIAITSSEVWIMTNKTSTTEKSQPLDVLNSALHVDTGNLTPMPEMPEMANTLKRSLELSPLLGQKAESPSLRDDIKHVLKHRKNEIKALKAELEALTQKKADSARRVEEARRRREEQERILNEEYEALEREKLDVLQSIAADQEAEEEHLRGLEDDSE
ncbi:hypothetical protein MMC32_001344 [Xylographa parallela]|nr:hypothetical protein [Xylographa parallela]